MLLSLAAPSSVLAFVTTIHFALIVLRAHRGPRSGIFNFVIVVSVLFAASPWLLMSPAGLAVGLAAHLGWFVACEQLLPVAKPAPVKLPAPAASKVASAPPLVAAAARAPHKPRDFVLTPVLSVFDETPEIRTFRVARPEGFEFQPGQFLTVRVRAEGKEHARCYSISSSPAARGYLEISVKRLGLVSGALHAMLKPGSMLAVRAPAGAFTYPAGEDRAIVLIAGGVGITPLMSMLRHAILTEPMRPITLFFSVRTEADVAFREELRLFSLRHPQFRLFLVITDGPAGDGNWPGRIDEALFRATTPDIAHATCLICGPQPMLDAMTTMLLAVGVPRPQIHFEIFQAAIAASAGRPAAAPSEPAAPPPSGLQARFERSGVTAAVGADQTLLEAAELCGASIPSLCRVGVCGTCRVRVMRGEVDCASQILDDRDREEGYVLPCVTRVKSSCTVDA